MGALVAERRGNVAEAPVGAATAAPSTPAPAPAPEAKPVAQAEPVATPALPSAASQPQPATTSARAFVISTVRPRDAAAFAEYRALAEASITAHRGRYVVRGGAPQALEGTAPDSVVIVEFPSRSAAEAWYRSPDYAKALALSGQALERTLTLVDGVPSETKAWQPRVVTAQAVPRVAAELSATTLLWAAFKSWLSSLFSKRS
ncbi:MAG: DUF1330 domain-containing protein [Proteobacteria bacterium]|nr:DUF1330 domain-containing protein [Pseudomonadota bacterium]